MYKFSSKVQWSVNFNLQYNFQKYQYFKVENAKYNKAYSFRIVLMNILVVQIAYFFANYSCFIYLNFDFALPAVQKTDKQSIKWITKSRN